MDLDGRSQLLELQVQLRGASQGFQSRLHGALRMALWIRIGKNSHQAITGRFVDVASIGVNTVQKIRKIALNERVHLLGHEGFAEAGVATNIDKKDGDILLAFL